ncbi:MAG: hypothetical protein GX601_13045 [Anaerolineales bacterium]|nr:hypothetical protein [Anaerolineales bacterium]
MSNYPPRSQSPETVSGDRPSRIQWGGRFTVEVALWLVVVGVALALRLPGLGAAPLSASEAHHATLAWRAVTANEPPRDGAYSPVLLAANALTFATVGASDALARLWPLVAGTLLVAAPALLCRQMGRVSALGAALMLAFSPTAIVASRRVDAVSLAALGAMVFLGGLLQFVHTYERRWALASAAGLALALATGAQGFTLVAPLALAGAAFAVGYRPAEDVKSVGAALHANRALILLMFAGMLVALATGMGWHPAGLTAVGDGWVAWVRGSWAPGTQEVSPLALLALYEPLCVCWGVVGLIGLLRRRASLGAFLALWAGLGLVGWVMSASGSSLDGLTFVLPLALLAGVGLGRLVEQVARPGVWRAVRLYVPVMLVLGVYLALVVGQYGARGQNSSLYLAIVTMLLQMLLLALFALATSAESALVALGIGSSVLMLIYTLSAGCGAAHARASNPRELLATGTTAAEVRELVTTLEELSWQQTGLRTTLAFTYEAPPDSVLAWHLREFSAATRVDDLDSVDSNAPVLVTTRRHWAPANDGHVGQDFVLQRSWEPSSMSCDWRWPPQCSEGVRWWLLRRTATPPTVSEWAMLWVSEPE